MAYRRKRYGKRRKYGMRSRRRVASKKRVYRRKRTVRRAKSRRTVPKIARQVNRLSKAVNQLKFFDSATMGLKILKTTVSYGLQSGKNKWAQASYPMFRLQDCGAAVSSLRVYDTSFNDWVITGTGDFRTKKSTYILGGYDHVHLRNNNACPCYVELYLCYPRRATAREPASYYLDDCKDLGISTDPDLDLSTDFHPSFAPGLRQAYKCIKKLGREMVPGSKAAFVHRVPNFKYDTGNFAAADADITKRLRTHVWWIRVRGTAHYKADDVTKVGYGSGTIEFIITNTINVRYDAGRAITYQVNDNNLADVGLASEARMIPSHSACSTTYAA